MNINPILSGGIPVPAAENKGSQKTASSSSVARRDKVEISKDSASKDATTAGIAAVAMAHEPTRSDRIEEARQRVASGYYDRPEVQDEIVNRLIDRM
jgi:anti-sigma28 factor (negative regulator of flagellin synthesis)